MIFTSIAGFVHVMENGPEKSWNFTISFSRSGNSWSLSVGHGNAWKVTENYFSEDNEARNTLYE